MGSVKSHQDLRRPDADCTTVASESAIAAPPTTQDRSAQKTLFAAMADPARLSSKAPDRTTTTSGSGSVGNTFRGSWREKFLRR